MLRRSLPLLLGSLALLAAALPASDASACSPPAPGLSGSIPKSGDTYPANAALFFEGHYLSLAGVTATIDGQAATLNLANDINIPGQLIARVSPTPAAGQKVKLAGKFCDEPTCDAVEIEYTAGAADDAAPPATAISSFEVYDHANFKSSGGDCNGDVDVSYWVHLSSTGLDPAESPRLYTVEAYRDAQMKDLAVSRTAFVRELNQTTGFDLVEAQLKGAAPAEALCFRVITQDAAGNSAAPSELLCKPCHFKADATPINSPPDEPQWSAADVYAGGPCDPGGGGTGGGGTGGSDPGTGGNDPGTGGNDPGTGGNGTGGNAPGPKPPVEDDDSGCSFRGPSGASSVPTVAGLALAIAVLGRASRRRARR